MLDPSPKLRITARQSMSLLDRGGGGGWDRLKNYSCAQCSSTTNIEVSNLPLHSIFKASFGDKPGRQPLRNPEVELEEKVMPDWQAMKREWLAEHMWW
jgi:hypothetical protein